MRFSHTLLGVSLLAAFSSGSALASGYHFGSQSASAQGTANANAAEAADASVLFYNPAGLTRLKGLNVSGVLDIVVPDGSFENQGTVTVLGLPTGGGNGGKFIRTTAVPHAYMSKSLTEDLTFGFGAFVPFGSKSEYDSDWVGRYNIISTELQTLALNPSLSFKLNPKFSVGAGLTAQYIHGKLVKGTDFGSGALASIIKSGVSLPSSVIAAISGNPTYSGLGTFSGKDWGVGFNLGLMYEPVEGTRLGLAYRSKIAHQLSGNAVWDVATPADNLATTLNAISAGLGTKVKSSLLATYTNTEASLKVDTPESLSASVYHESGRLALMADVTRTRHSRFQELRVDFVTNSQPDSTTPEHWTDTTRVSLGASYKLSDSFKLSGGFAVDQSPVNDSNRTASIPDNKRTWYSAGLNWKLDENRSVDLAYSYIHIASGNINNFDNGGQVTSANVANCNIAANTSSCATIKGRYTLSSSLLGLQFNQRF
jgi:long-chain fatty acid transport protein